MILIERGLAALSLVLLLMSLAGCRSESIQRGTSHGDIELTYKQNACSITSAHRETEPYMRLRFECADERAYLAGLAELAKTWREDSLPIQSLYLGRVDQQVIHGGLGGLSRMLARISASSAEWDSKAGRARSLDSNAWMNEALKAPKLLAPYAEVLGKAGYRVTGASVEKVRWIDAKEDPTLAAEGLKGRLAWDAQLHLKIESALSNP